jgi:cardiolipin synthase
VRIFEFTPGFCHAKQCVCDGKIASVGTSNLDYRSLYLHYENNVLFSDCDAVKQVERDFDSLFSVSREVTEQYRTGRKAILAMWQCILRLFAPMM